MRRSALQGRDTNADSPRDSKSTGKLTGAGFGVVHFKKEFKAPTPAASRGAAVDASNSRKRKKISYKGQDNSKDADDDSDDSGKNKKKRDFGEFSPPPEIRKWGKIGSNSKSGINNTLKSNFAIPEMRNKQGQVIETRFTAGALGVCRRIASLPRPLHNPMEDAAIVLYDPTIDDLEVQAAAAAAAAEAERQKQAQQEAEANGPHKSLAAMLGLDKKVDTKNVKVPVVIDPKLGRILRPHQVEGVKFLYQACSEKIAPGAMGCIMADEMGLDECYSSFRMIRTPAYFVCMPARKTLQCITLLYTLLRQSPKAGKGTIEKAIVACPASLVRNWANELVKWLGPGAINPLPIDGSLSRGELLAAIRGWCSATGRAVQQPVIIVSYESLRSLTEELGEAPVGLLLADEAHRLKNATNSTYMALNQINVRRRVLLTGTPVQNDLTEYFSLLNFANPGILGTRNEFKKNYENAILKGRDLDATENQKEMCQTKLKELIALVNKFVIRRTNDLLTKYLPVKHEHVVFCSPSPLQIDLYKLLTQSPEVRGAIRESGKNPLVAIGMFQKLCAHPDLIDLSNIPNVKDILPEGYDPTDRRRELVAEFSGKMLVLERFLEKMYRDTDDKIVLVSNFTETLDFFEKLLRKNRYGYFRLEGSTTIKKRQKLVDQFNNPSASERVFLLSSKAGGCGINLIGANRLILFDPDWNPASDQQALARVWRDGQKKSCFVYRFLTTGTVEEKIFQRQAHKQALSASVVDAKEDEARHFSVDELKKLFYFKETTSETHDTFKCKRCRNGKQFIKAPAMLYGDTSTWNHLENDCLAKIHDDLLRNEAGLGAVSKVFQFISS